MKACADVVERVEKLERVKLSLCSGSKFCRTIFRSRFRLETIDLNTRIARQLGARLQCA